MVWNEIYKKSNELIIYNELLIIKKRLFKVRIKSILSYNIGFRYGPESRRLTTID